MNGAICISKHSQVETFVSQGTTVLLFILGCLRETHQPGMKQIVELLSALEIRRLLGVVIQEHVGPNHCSGGSPHKAELNVFQSSDTGGKCSQLEESILIRSKLIREKARFVHFPPPVFDQNGYRGLNRASSVTVTLIFTKFVVTLSYSPP